jgi:hypothetical protein
MAKAKQTAKDANAKTSQAAATKANAKTKTPKAAKKDPVVDLNALAVVPETPEVPEAFKSMCGFDFDPSEAGSCHKTCQGENPEAFAACTVNFKATAKKTTAGASKSRRGKNVWGHLIGCQGELIDQQFLVVGGAHSLEDIMKAAGATRPRVISHLKHLYSVWGVDLRITEDSKYFIQNGLNSEDLVGAKSNGVKIIDVAVSEAA